MNLIENLFILKEILELETDLFFPRIKKIDPDHKVIRTYAIIKSRVSFYLDKIASGCVYDEEQVKEILDEIQKLDDNLFYDLQDFVKLCDD